MLAFVLALLSSLRILLPHELGFSSVGGDAFRRAGPAGALDLADVYLPTAVWINERARMNQATLRRLAVWLTVSCLLLSIEIVLFGVSLIR